MSQTLMVRFGADTSAAKRAVVELASTVSQAAVTMATAVRGSADAIQTQAGLLERLPGAAKGAIAAFIAFEAVKFAFGSVANSIEEVHKQLAKLVAIGAQAQGAGVGTTFLQGWLAQAKSLNEEASTLEGMLKRAREASTVRQGQNGDDASSEMASRLALQAKAGNVGRADVAAFTGAADQEARIRVILDLIDRLMNEGKQLAALDIAGKMFGSGFEDKLRSGVDIVGRMRDALNGLTTGADGRIIPQSEIDGAKRITETLEQASRIMTEAMRPVNEDLARLAQQQALSWAEMKVSVSEMVGYLMSVYKWASNIRDAFAEWGNSSFWKDAVKWMDSKGLIDKSFAPPGIDNGFEKAGPDKPAEGSPLTVKISPRADTSRSLPKVGGGSKTTETDPVDSFINSIERSTAALKAEIDAYAKSNAEKRVAIDLAKAEEIAKQNGTKVTAEQEARIRAASAAAAEHKDKLQDLDQAQRQAAESARYFGDIVSSSLSDAIFNGAKLSDIFRDISSMLGRGALQALMTGQGPLAGFLGMSPKASEGSDAVGGLMGLLKSGVSAASGGGGFLSSIGAMFRANGGPVQAGRTYRVNELGEEFFTPSRDGYVTPASRGGGGGFDGPAVQIIDQRTMDAPAPEVRRGPGGSQQIVLRDAENALAARARSGRGALAPALSSPANRRG